LAVEATGARGGGPALLPGGKLMFGLPFSSALLLFIIPGILIGTMFYYSRRIEKGTWD